MQSDVLNCLIKDSDEELYSSFIKNKKISIDLIIDSNSLIQSTQTFKNYPLLHNNPSLLCCAAYFRAQKCFSLLIQNGAQVDLTDFYNTPLTHFAVVGNSIEILNFIHQLITTKFNSNLSFESSIFTVIEYGTVDQKNFQILEWLYTNHWFKRNDVDPRGYSLIQCAIEFDRVEFLKFFVENVGCQIRSTSFVPLCFAFRRKSYKSVNYLLDKYKTSEANNSTTTTPFAFSYFNSDSIDINQKDEYNNTAIHYAAEYGDVSIIQKILNFQTINLTVMNNDGKTPIDLAANDEIVELITKKKNEIEENRQKMFLLQKQREEEEKLKKEKELAENQDQNGPTPILDNTKSTTCLMI